MQRWIFAAVFTFLLSVWALSKASQKVSPLDREWAKQMENYCENLAGVFERLESYHKRLATDFKKVRNERMAELHEQLADGNDQVAGKINELQDAYLRLAKS